MGGAKRPASRFEGLEMHFVAFQLKISASDEANYSLFRSRSALEKHEEGQISNRHSSFEWEYRTELLAFPPAHTLEGTCPLVHN